MNLRAGIAFTIALSALAVPAVAQDITASPAEAYPVKRVSNSGTGDGLPSNISAALPSVGEPQWRTDLVAYWVSKGINPNAAQGIADQAAKESGGNPTIIGDGGSSIGIFQHHAARMDRVLARIESDQAWSDLMGEDPVAAAHWDEIKNARTRNEASKLWQRYFERPAGTPSQQKGAHAQEKSDHQRNPAYANNAGASPYLAPASLDPFSTESGEAGSSFLITQEIK